jgi:hypothetical protein
MILAVSRDDIRPNQAEAYQVVKHIETPDFSSTVGPHIKFNDFHVPAFNLLATPGQGIALVTRCMKSSTAFVKAMSWLQHLKPHCSSRGVTQEGEQRFY